MKPKQKQKKTSEQIKQKSIASLNKKQRKPKPNNGNKRGTHGEKQGERKHMKTKENK